MRRNTSILIWWLLLLVVVVGGDRLLALVLDRVVSGSEIRFSQLYAGRVPRGVVILGNSRAVNTFYAPALSQALDRRVYNLGHNGISVEMSEVLFADLLDRNPEPELVVIELTMLGGEQGALNGLKMYARRSPRMTALYEREFPAEATATRVSHLFSLNCELFLRALQYRGQSDQSWINRSRISQELLESVPTMEPTQLPLEDGKLASLRRILTHAHSREIEVRLVLGPYLPLYADKISNLEIWLSTIRAEVEPAVPVWDLSRIIRSSDAFADRIHLNERGAREVGDRLARCGFFLHGAVPGDCSEVSL